MTPPWRGLLLGELLFGLHLSSSKLGKALRPNEQGQGTPLHHELFGRLPVHRHPNAPTPPEGDAVGPPAPADEQAEDAHPRAEPRAAGGREDIEKAVDRRGGG